MSLANGTAVANEAPKFERATPTHLGTSIACPLCSGRKGGCTSCHGTGEAMPSAHQEEKSSKRTFRRAASIL